MLDITRELISTHLMAQGIGVLSVSGGEGAWATPAPYRATGLALDCLVPRWADVAYHLEHDSAVLLVVLGSPPHDHGRPLRWLEYRGTARPLATPNWDGLLPDGAPQALAEDLYLVVNLSPKRIDLFDEARGWGARETLDF